MTRFGLALSFASMICDVAKADILAGRRVPRVLYARDVVTVAAHRMGFSYPDIARAFGQKSHSKYTHAELRLRNAGPEWLDDEKAVRLVLSCIAAHDRIGTVFFNDRKVAAKTRRAVWAVTHATTDEAELDSHGHEDMRSAS